jgi:tRNA1Val (adenine37-N6)-methyltransferase
MDPAVAVLADLERPDALSDDLLCGDWRILQLRRGHRFSTDDVLTAWTAARLRPQARRLLDLGAGIGSVGLQTLWRMAPDARLWMIEAQEVSHRLARRTVARNGLEGRVVARLADLRDEGALLPEERQGFELVTGSPPYIPLGRGHVSPHTQRAHARMELRGDVGDYCRAAARAMAPGAALALCHSAVDPRPELAIAAAGLQLLWRQDVLFRAGRAPTIALFACAWEGERDDPPPVVVRDRAGRWTEQYLEIRREMGADVDRLRA